MCSNLPTLHLTPCQIQQGQVPVGSQGVEFDTVSTAGARVSMGAICDYTKATSL